MLSYQEEDRTIRSFPVLATLLLATAAQGQVLPLPLPDDQLPVLGALVQAYKDKDVSEYAALLADDVHVTIDDTVVARSRAEWIERFGKKLATDGVFLEIRDAYQASGHLLTVEYFNSVESFLSQTRHCCWRYDAVQYTIRDGKISSIRLLTGGDIVR